MPGRTWVIVADVETLNRRWETLISAAEQDKEDLFQPHLRGGKLGNKHSMKIVVQGLTGHETRRMPFANQGQRQMRQTGPVCVSFF